MKTKLIQILYHLSAFLADKTKGFSLFSKWKLALGSLLIGVSVLSCKQKNNIVSQQFIEPKKDTIDEITCYDQAAPIDTTISQKDTIKKAKTIQPVTVDEGEITCYKPAITCYDVAVVPTPIIEKQDSNIIYEFVEIQPKFPGGEEAMLDFIRENLQYPKELGEFDLIGMVYLQFIVTKDGNIEQIKILKSIHPLWSNEAIRVVKLMPKWIPGQQNGESVSCYFRMPIRIHLE